jgi:hypothetical protein
VNKRTHSEREKKVSATATAELLRFVQHLAHERRAELPAALPAPADPREQTENVLGEPLDMRGVAKLIGCSGWTVRQKYVPAGLPHLRSGPNGKLLFYKNQVIRWLLRQQQKGGITL